MKEPDEDEDDGGRGIAVVFMTFVGREGDALAVGVGALSLVGVVRIVALTALVKLTLKTVARCGRGLIGLADFSEGDGGIADISPVLSSSLSSSEILNLLRVPALVGDGGLRVLS